ncbi:uncharacterized protein LOC130649604 [Hydractinia symbiolongicarpus]|uniref:uncharacterized protein LOC130649604 n=1 Tax=Hydractinia symbiolongicarpus TaxID=13093 RepID=UPI00254EABE3|nr:uncharacterized protein LOC130649604 [Hydractinia symbiolongicarpus]
MWRNIEKKTDEMEETSPFLNPTIYKTARMKSQPVRTIQTFDEKRGRYTLLKIESPWNDLITQNTEKSPRLIKPRKSFEDIKRDVANKEEFTKKQVANIMTKRDKRSIAVILIGVLIESEMPLYFYESLEKSQHLRRILNSFIKNSKSAETLLNDLVHAS